MPVYDAPVTTLHGAPASLRVEVNGPDRTLLYAELAGVPDGDGKAWEITWNLEKFVMSPQGKIVARFRSNRAPDAPEVVAAIEAQLPAR